MAEEREAKQILSSISDDVRAIVRAEVALAKSEILPSAKAGGLGAGLFGGAGYFALNGLSLLFIAASLALSMLIKDLWPIGFVIMGVVLLVIAGALALVGKGQLAKAKAAKPTEAIAEANTTIAEVKAAVARANAAAKGPRELSPSAPTRELR